ncbi:hypothetical protein BaRGS_00002451, partial [Batillaria attramentaria]
DASLQKPTVDNGNRFDKRTCTEIYLSKVFTKSVLKERRQNGPNLYVQHKSHKTHSDNKRIWPSDETKTGEAEPVTLAHEVHGLGHEPREGQVVRRVISNEAEVWDAALDLLLLPLRGRLEEERGGLVEVALLLGTLSVPEQITTRTSGPVTDDL